MNFFKKIYINYKRRKKYVSVRFGNNVKILNNPKIGNFTYVGDNSIIGPNVISIGKYCSIAFDCKIGLNEHPLYNLSSSSLFYSESWRNFHKQTRISNSDLNNKKIIIGNDVWIGAQVIILNNVTIGNGSIIGAGSVVTKNVEPFSIVAGNPAKFIKERFNVKTIQFIEKSKWWDLDTKSAFEIYNNFNK